MVDIYIELYQFLYYKIYIEASDMIVMVPVEKAEGLGIRPIVSAEEAEEALNLLATEIEPVTSDWKLRYQMNLDLLKKGTIKDISSIVRCLSQMPRKYISTLLKTSSFATLPETIS